MKSSSAIPVAVGGVGGSGTRVVANLLRHAGYFVGDDLNRPLDNLWFALFFTRASILDDPRFGEIVDLFSARMSDPAFRADERSVALLDYLIERQAAHRPADWLQERRRSFLRPSQSTQDAWGWKAPNTHMVIDRLLERLPTLRYVHVMRNGLDMAFSSNQRQVGLWSGYMLGREAVPGPRDSLAFWCAVHRRIEALSERFPGRIMLVNFDSLCQNPAVAGRNIMTFCRRDMAESEFNGFVESVLVPRSTGRFRDQSFADFDPDDVAYVGSLGFPTR